MVIIILLANSLMSVRSLEMRRTMFGPLTHWKAETNEVYSSRLSTACIHHVGK
jgi:hypothetical protein